MDQRLVEMVLVLEQVPIGEMLLVLGLGYGQGRAVDSKMEMELILGWGRVEDS